MFCSEDLAIIKKCRLQLIFISGYFFPHLHTLLWYIRGKCTPGLNRGQEEGRISTSVSHLYEWTDYMYFCLHLKSAGRSAPQCFNLPPTLHYLSYSHGRDPTSHYVLALTLRYHHQCQGEVNPWLEASYMQGCSPQWPVSSWGLHVKFNFLFTLNFYHLISLDVSFLVYLWSVLIEIVVLNVWKCSQNARSGISDIGPICYQIPLFLQMITQQINNKPAVCIFLNTSFCVCCRSESTSEELCASTITTPLALL